MSFAAPARPIFSYGFLEGAGVPLLSMFYVWPLMGGAWAVFVVMAQRHQR